MTRLNIVEVVEWAAKKCEKCVNVCRKVKKRVHKAFSFA
jgi:hypothetical protein